MTRIYRSWTRCMESYRPPGIRLVRILLADCVRNIIRLDIHYIDLSLKHQSDELGEVKRPKNAPDLESVPGARARDPAGPAARALGPGPEARAGGPGPWSRGRGPGGPGLGAGPGPGSGVRPKPLCERSQPNIASVCAQAQPAE